MEIPVEYTLDYFLSAAECNAEKEMSLNMLVQRIIDIATAHATALGVGYERLLQDNNAWVLSRLSIAMDRFPTIDEHYSMTTWVEDFNRRFSERIICISDSNGNPLGYARTTWVAINIATRRPADLSPLSDRVVPSTRTCPVERNRKMLPIEHPDITTNYKFRYSDIDFNRHVNSARYVEYMLNRWDVDYHDSHYVSRFDIAYHAEVHFTDVVDVLWHDDLEADTHDFEISRNGTVCTRARIAFSPRKTQPE